MTRTSRSSCSIISMILWLVLLLPSSFTFAYNWECNLYCYNNGECRHGKGKFGSYAGLDDETFDPTATESVEPLYKEGTLVYGMYCRCPMGYTGLQCEIKLNVCGRAGADQHYCFNGLECAKEKTDSGLTYYRCECDPFESNLEAPYATKYCEHIATVFCGQKAEVGSGATSSGKYCTNGGACVGRGDGPKMCDCPPGWEGKHCETQSVGMIGVASGDSKGGLGVGYILLISILTCCCIVGCTSYYRARKDEKLRNSNYSTTKITKVSRKKQANLPPPIELETDGIMA